ncbi:hypothetical protein B0G82_0553 [Paraburkholderia sp. BL17N1]|nr:hypothetical protein B0G82_0553 [Paraburkholderia sp. BL17N1]
MDFAAELSLFYESIDALRKAGRATTMLDAGVILRLQ